MGWVLMAASFAYAFTDVFGAWTVVRRKPRLSFLFMLAAATLTVGGVAAFYRLPETWAFLAAGSAASSLASWLNARMILGRTVVPNHLARAAVGLALVVLAVRAFV